MKKLFILATAFISFNSFAACNPPAEFFKLIPKEDLKLVTTDGKFTFTRSNQFTTFDVYEIASMNNPHVNSTKYMLSDYSEGNVKKNGRTLKCHFTVTKNGEDTVIDFKLYKSWRDTGGYITRNSGNIVIRNGEVVSADLQDATSYKYFSPAYFPFQTESSFKY